MDGFFRVLTVVVVVRFWIFYRFYNDYETFVVSGTVRSKLGSLDKVHSTIMGSVCLAHIWILVRPKVP